MFIIDRGRLNCVFDYSQIRIVQGINRFTITLEMASVELMAMLVIGYACAFHVQGEYTCIICEN